MELKTGLALIKHEDKYMGRKYEKGIRYSTLTEDPDMLVIVWCDFDEFLGDSYNEDNFIKPVIFESPQAAQERANKIGYKPTEVVLLWDVVE